MEEPGVTRGGVNDRNPERGAFSSVFIIIMTIIVAGKNPVSEGEVSTIEIQRGEDDQLNISIVGGADTPLVSPVFSCLHSGFFFSPSPSDKQQVIKTFPDELVEDCTV